MPDKAEHKIGQRRRQQHDGHHTQPDTHQALTPAGRQFIPTQDKTGIGTA